MNEQETLQEQKVRSPKQILQQDICQKYGWSCVLLLERHPIKEKEGTAEGEKVDAYQKEKEEISQQLVQVLYICKVQTSYQQRYLATSNTSEVHVYELMIEQLQEPLRIQKSKPIMTLQEYFILSSNAPEGTTSNTTTQTRAPKQIPIYDSHDKRNWDYFWKHKPSVVGIDTEGNGVSPPILIQIAVIETHQHQHQNSTTTRMTGNEISSYYCIIEAPKRKRTKLLNQNNHPVSPASISKDLQRLLNDTSIIKVFCDNFSHKDKTALDIRTIGIPSIVELEEKMKTLFGTVKTARGLSNIVSLTIAPDIQISKSYSPATTNHDTNTQVTSQQQNNQQRYRSIKKFSLLERGIIPPITNIFNDLSHNELQYAALDAYFTVLVFQFLESINQ